MAGRTGRRLLRGIGFAFATLMLVEAVFGFVTGSHGPTTHRFECHRSSGTCASSFPVVGPTIALADIASVELGTSRVTLGRGGAVETESFVQLTTKDGKARSVTPSTADRATIAAYADEVARIEAFLSSTAPDVLVSVDVKDSSASVSNDRMNAGLCAFTGIVLFVLLLRGKPNAERGGQA